MPYGTVGVRCTEDHDPATVEEALDLGQRLWGQGRFFEAHECLEHVWHAAGPDDRDLWQGVIQVAVAAVHVQRGNAVGAAALLRRAGERLQRYPDVHRGIDVAVARRFCRETESEVVRRVESLPQDPSNLAWLPFPAGPGGAWFTPDPDALEPPSTPTPVPDEPVWRAADRPRLPRRRDQG